ncbi:hypothetical protein [Ammoniphilus resinae]|uniref:Uncharacterized protein n=1 Tax=Ammoniphilus resinae TaxID=861532 RepID=A0ABS4GNW6_9BACL|nr:hypothetical protein [Ammoniphilus resinae]MBP1931958.1 hypothetical protein [Ammoniphilus resinae]
MNLFLYKNKKEDHVTNILMNILSLDKSLLEKFLPGIIGNFSKDLLYKEINIKMDQAKNPNKHVPLNFIIGITPSEENIIPQQPFQGTDTSRPDLWIYGDNFTVLIEIKIAGALEPSQIQNHRNKFDVITDEIIITWKEILKLLETIKPGHSLLVSFLVDEFIKYLTLEGLHKVTNKSRKGDGTFSNFKKPKDPHFEFRRIDKGLYEIYKVIPSKNIIEFLPGSETNKGPLDCRIWTANYILEHYPELSNEGFINGDPPSFTGHCSYDNAWGQCYIQTLLLWRKT